MLEKEKARAKNLEKIADKKKEEKKDLQFALLHIHDDFEWD